MNRITKVIILALAILAAALLFYAANKSRYRYEYSKVADSDEVNVSATPKPSYLKSSYLIPVTNFTSDIYLVDKDTRLYISKEDADLFDNEQGWKLSRLEKTEVESAIAQGKVVLVRLEDLKPQWRGLPVNGLNFWEAEVEEFPFVIKEEIAQEPLPADITTIFAAGEIIPARAVDRLGLNVFNDYRYLFDAFADDIAAADLAVALLENPLSGDPSPCTGCTTFVGDEKAAQGFADVGLDIISLAGNHAGDGGQTAYANTVSALESAGVKFTGTGKTDEQLLKPAIAEIEGRRVGIVAADDIAYFYWSYAPDGTSYSTNRFSDYANGSGAVNQERVARLKQIKQEYKLDELIVFMSWGIEYTNKATEHQQELARALIDNGVDIVLGSHPHWVQNIEFYKEKPIIYSLGNFIFDQTHTLATRQGVTLELVYANEVLKTLHFTPHQTCGYHQTGNNLTAKYLAGEVSLNQVRQTAEANGCVYWQPQKLDIGSAAYRQIFERIFQYSKI